VKLVDANVLLYAVNTDAPQHRAARGWLDEALNATLPVAFSWLVLVAFVRVSTHRSLLRRPLTTDESTGVVRTWLAQPGAVLMERTQRHVDIWRGLLCCKRRDGQPGQRRAPGCPEHRVRRRHRLLRCRLRTVARRTLASAAFIIMMPVGDAMMHACAPRSTSTTIY